MFSLYSKMPKIVFNNIVFTGIVALYFLLVLNFPLIEHMADIYKKSNANGAEGVSVFFIVIGLFAVGVLLYSIFLILFSWRYVLKAGLSFITLLGALCTIATMKYGVVFDQDMVRNFMQTNTAEALSYLSFSSVVTFTLLGIIPAFIIITAPITYPQGFVRSNLIRIGAIVGTLALAGTIVLAYYQQFSFVGRNNKSLNREINPTTVLYSTYRVIKLDYFSAPPEPVLLGEDAKIITKRKEPMAMILVLGETGRAANYQYRGYDRKTNPYTSKLHMYGFNNVSSCGTATARSVPCMFSNLTRDAYKDELIINRDNVLDVLKKTGVNVTWIDNQGDCKGVCDRMNVVNIKAEKNPNCVGGRCYDAVLVEKVEPYLKDIKKDTVIAVHLMGSHGPRYYERYPKNFEKFTPACNRADVENCSTEEVINAYDNTILYTDYVISKLYAALEKSPTENKALLYISDHGESLGENGVYLHGLPYAVAPEVQKQVPMQLYISENAEKKLALNEKCLEQQGSAGKFSHDNLFHTLLGIFDVSTKDYNPSLDILRACRA